jgi:hypothetical protein
LELDYTVWVGVSERIDTLIVVSGDKQNRVIRAQRADKFLIASVEILELVNDQMIDSRQLT